MPPTTTARSHSTFRDDLSGWENDFDHSVVPPNKEAEWKPKNPSWDETLRDAVETETTSGFEWEDQLALRATSELMSPSRMQRAMGKILQRGYDQQRAVPLAVDLARVPSPNRPAWQGLGTVPKQKAPKREKDWWAPAELDLQENHREHGRLGQAYADGTKPLEARDLSNNGINDGVHPGDGGFRSPKKHLGKDWVGLDPYRGKNTRYARIPGEEKWWHPRELGMGTWDGDVDGEVSHDLGGRGWEESDESDESDASDESSHGSYESGDEDVEGAIGRRAVRRTQKREARRTQRREARRAARRNARYEQRQRASDDSYRAENDKERRRGVGGGPNGVGDGRGTTDGGARSPVSVDAHGHVIGHGRDDGYVGGNNVSGGGLFGDDGRRGGGGGRNRPGVKSPRGGRAGGDGGLGGTPAGGKGNGGAGAKGGAGGNGGKAGREMGTDPDLEPEKKKKKRWLLCC